MQKYSFTIIRRAARDLTARVESYALTGELIHPLEDQSFIATDLRIVLSALDYIGLGVDTDIGGLTDDEIPP